MTHRTKMGNELYQNLGKLFYAMAMADHSVHMNEMEKFNEANIKCTKELSVGKMKRHFQV